LSDDPEQDKHDKQNGGIRHPQAEPEARPARIATVATRPPGQVTRPEDVVFGGPPTNLEAWQAVCQAIGYLQGQRVGGGQEGASLAAKPALGPGEGGRHPEPPGR
jgi:hypothetical protein